MNLKHLECIHNSTYTILILQPSRDWPWAVKEKKRVPFGALLPIPLPHFLWAVWTAEKPKLEKKIESRAWFRYFESLHCLLTVCEFHWNNHWCQISMWSLRKWWHEWHEWHEWHGKDLVPWSLRDFFSDRSTPGAEDALAAMRGAPHGAHEVASLSVGYFNLEVFPKKKSPNNLTETNDLFQGNVSGGFRLSCHEIGLFLLRKPVPLVWDTVKRCRKSEIVRIIKTCLQERVNERSFKTVDGTSARHKSLSPASSITRTEIHLSGFPLWKKVNQSEPSELSKLCLKA